MFRPLRFFTVNHLQQRARGSAAHFLQRLSHGRERWIVRSCAQDVVETYDGNLCRHLYARFAQDGDGSIAARSLKAKIAVKCTPRSSSLTVAARPGSVPRPWSSSCVTRRGLISIPSSAATLQMARQRASVSELKV